MRIEDRLVRMRCPVQIGSGWWFEEGILHEGYRGSVGESFVGAGSRKSGQVVTTSDLCWTRKRS